MTGEIDFKAMKDWREEGNTIRESERNLAPHSCGLITPWPKFSVFQHRGISRLCRGSLRVDEWAA